LLQGLGEEKENRVMEILLSSIPRGNYLPAKSSVWVPPDGADCRLAYFREFPAADGIGVLGNVLVHCRLPRNF